MHVLRWRGLGVVFMKLFLVDATLFNSPASGERHAAHLSSLLLQGYKSYSMHYACPPLAGVGGGVYEIIFG